MDEKELESIFQEQGAEPAPETPQPQPEDGEAQPDGPARDESGRFAKRDETGVETPQEDPAEAVVPTDQPLPKEDYQALKAERLKRQEAQQQLEALRQQVARQQPQPREQQEPDPNFWDDPDAAMQSRFEKFGEQLIQRFQQQQHRERIDASETAAKAKYDDYDDAFRAFQQSAMQNPALVQQMTSAQDPAEFAYKTGKTALEVQRYGSVDELLKAERAKWEAEARAAIPQPRLPTSTALDGTVGARGGPALPSTFNLNAVFDD